jgi:hypothetical protein
MGLRLPAVALGGVLVFLAGYPLQWPWLELFAFLPLLDAARTARSFREAAGYGLGWGLGRALPMAVMLKGFALPVEGRLAVLAYVSALDALFAFALERVASRHFAAVGGDDHGVLELRGQ